MEIEQTVRVTLSELTDNYIGYESFMDLLQEKVEQEISRELSFWQVVDYTIVGHEPAAVFIKVEGYEENA